MLQDPSAEPPELKRESKLLASLVEEALVRGDLAAAIDFAEAHGRLLADRFHARSEFPDFEARVGRILNRLETGRVRPRRCTVPSASGRHVVHAISGAEDTRGHANACWNVVRGLSGMRRQALLVLDRSDVRYRNLRLGELLAACRDVELHSPPGRDRAKRLLWAADWIDAHAAILVWHANAVDLDLWLLAQMAKPPVVYVHHPPPYTHLAFGRWEAEVHVDIRRSNADFCGSRAPDHWKGRIVPVENGVGDLRWGSRSDRPVNGPYLLSVASGYKLFERSRCSTFLEKVVRPLLVRDPALRYVLLGHHSESLDSFRNGLEPHIRDRVYFMGQIDDTAPYYQHALCYLNPFPMGTGLSVLEALSAGLPVVSLAHRDDHPAYVEALDADQIVDDPDEYAARVSAFIADGAFRKAVGFRNRGVYERRYGLKAVAQRWQQLLAELEITPIRLAPPTKERTGRGDEKPRAIPRDDRPPFQPGLAVSEVVLGRWLRAPLRPAAWGELRHLHGRAVLRLAARQIERRRRRTRLR